MRWLPKRVAGAGEIGRHVAAAGGVVRGDAQVRAIDNPVREQPVERHPESGGTFHQAAAEVTVIKGITFRRILNASSANDYSIPIAYM